MSRVMGDTCVTRSLEARAIGRGLFVSGVRSSWLASAANSRCRWRVHIPTIVTTGFGR